MFNDPFDAVVEQLTDVLSFAGSNLAQNKFLYGFRIVVPGPGSSACGLYFVNAATIQGIL